MMEQIQHPNYTHTLLTRLTQAAGFRGMNACCFLQKWLINYGGAAGFRLRLEYKVHLEE